jgi:hypothetical protein
MSDENLKPQEFFDRMLLSNTHFERYPMMRPFVGNQYKSSRHKKVLVLAESHYWPEGTVPPTVAEWYGGLHPLELNKEQFKHLNTRGVVRAHEPGGGAKGYTRIFKNFAAEIQLADFDNDPTMCMDHVAFMNTFQRPAANRRSINGIDLEEDIKMAIDVVICVIKSLRPEFVCFASKLAWNTVGRKIESCHSQINPQIRFAHCAHAAWWRFHKKTGREAFRTFIQSAINPDATSNT